MATLLKVMQDLDDSAKTRVLSWAAGRFSLSPPAKAGKILPENANSVEESDKPEDASNATYTTIADLFVSSRAGTGPEKVRVTGYWHQELQKKSDFGSFEVNKELRDLGHQVNSINKVFDALIDQKPQLVVQVRKLGTGKQSRRRHKLTLAGINRVKEMLAGKEKE